LILIKNKREKRVKNENSTVTQEEHAMSLIPWNPSRDFEDFLQHYPRSLSRALSSASQELLTTSDWVPVVDISETPEAYLIKAELAGLKREDIKVKLEQGVLTLRGERRQEKKDKDKKHHRVERFYGSFARSFTLPEDADAEHIKAEYSEGLLTLSLPKLTVKPTHTREIDIQ
jgi:HSP20 family protein